MILVTGAGGLLGRALTTELTRCGVRWAAIHYPDVPRMDGVAALYHLCAENRHEAQMQSVNVWWTNALMYEAICCRVPRIVYASSVNVTRLERIGRDGWWRSSVYAHSKLAAERLVAEAGGVSVRLPPLYHGYGWRSWPVQALRMVLKGDAVSDLRTVEWAVYQLIEARP